MNRWNIPEWLEREVIDRDRSCVYCGVWFAEDGASYRDRPSWEHIINDASIVSPENIARCCVGCNASKGNKPLAIWFHSDYCLQRGINEDTVADVVKSALKERRRDP